MEEWVVGSWQVEGMREGRVDGRYWILKKLLLFDSSNEVRLNKVKIK